MPIKKVRLEADVVRETHIFRNADIRRPSINRAGWIGFHGTTTARATQIEREKVIRAFKVLNEAEIGILCGVGRELINTVPNRDRFEWLLAEAAAFSRRVGTVNFFSVSRQALEHTETKGGQGKELVLKPLVAAILANQQFGHLNPHRPDIERMNQRLAEADGTPVVYAVYLKGLGGMWLYDIQTAIQANGPIPSWRIVARLDAPDFTEYSDERKTVAEIESRRLTRTEGSQHFTVRLPTDPPGC